MASLFIMEPQGLSKTMTFIGTSKVVSCFKQTLEVGSLSEAIACMRTIRAGLFQKG